MNFFGHAVIAAAFRLDPRFVLGAMLPDFAGMVGARIGVMTDAAVQAGIDLHHQTDAAFHHAPQFVELMGSTMAELENAGLPRGPARATAHLGIELLLDGLLARDATQVERYQCALSIVSNVPDLNTLQDRYWVYNLAARLQSAPLPHGYANPDFVAGRIEYILGSRPRLRLEPTHFATVRHVLQGLQPRVRELEEDLMNHVCAQLETTGNMALRNPAQTSFSAI